MWHLTTSMQVWLPAWQTRRQSLQKSAELTSARYRTLFLPCGRIRRKSADSRASGRRGLDFVGYEIDKYYFEAQEKRFEECISQGSLFLQEVPTC